MSWDRSRRGWLRWRGIDGNGTRFAQIGLRPVTEAARETELVDTAVIPDTHPAYVLSTLWVLPTYRGQGFARAMLFRGARHLVELHETAWLGLMTDNFKLPSGRTRSDIRGAWESFLADHPTATVDSGFILLTPDLDLGG